MPDRLLLACFDVRKGLFQKLRKRQEFPPRRRRIRMTQQFPQFGDCAAYLCSSSGQAFLTLRGRGLPPGICFHDIGHRAAQHQFAMIEPNGVVA